MSYLGNERSGVQNPLIKYAVQAGWQYINQDEALKFRGGETKLIFREVFTTQIKELNPRVVDQAKAEDLIKRMERLPPRLEGNLKAWEYLKGLQTVYDSKEKRERNVVLIDEEVKNNIYQVTDEYTFTNGTYPNRYDVVFLINGIPVFFVETKAATKPDGMSEALTQVERYHRETPEAMTIFQIYTITHIIRFLYSGTWSYSARTLFNWKTESKAKDFEELVKTFFEKKNVVETLLNFILFTRQDDELKKVILRPHQMRAVDKIVERAEDKKKKRGLVWHTQGSGKTYTMIVAAQKILENSEFGNPTVLMLVDRTELETQLFGNLESVGFESVEVAKSKKSLREMLARGKRGLIVTMIHKFDKMPANVNVSSNVIVLVDEAHRTTGGDLGNYLMGALPNATYIGFTGTPIDRSFHGKGTFITFGKDDPPHGYLDKYSISESIEDGTTVKLHYTLAPNELLVDRKTLENEFLSMKETEGLSDIDELNRVLQKAVNLRNALKKPERVEGIAEFIADHFKKNVEPMGYKAFVVAVDREACALYKKELDKHMPKDYSEIVISPAHNDIELKKYHISDDEEKRIRKAFRNPVQKPKILIVTEKLLTGFDAPVLYCMYLDKPMRDHVLLQTIARVNRPYEDKEGKKKPCGFVLDFVGIFDRLEDALAFDSSDIEGIVEDIQVLKDRFEVLMGEGRNKYLPTIQGKKQDKAIEAVLTRFMDEKERTAFVKFYLELSEIYEIVSPDMFLRQFIDDYDILSRMFRIVKEAYDPSPIIDRELTRKTIELLHKNTKAGKVSGTLKTYEIDGDTIKKLEESNASDTEKVFNLLKSLDKDVSENRADKPYLVSIGERAEVVMLLYKQRQIDTEETLDKLKDLVKLRNAAEEERKSKRMNPDIFAVYWLLRQSNVDKAEQIATEMRDAFDAYPHWKMSEEYERKLKREMLKVLINNGVDVSKATEICSDVLRKLKGVAQ